MHQVVIKNAFFRECEIRVLVGLVQEGVFELSMLAPQIC